MVEAFSSKSKMNDQMLQQLPMVKKVAAECFIVNRHNVFAVGPKETNSSVGASNKIIET